MARSNQRLLLNAEPFGFGPTAAIATFFPDLRERFEHVAYIGKGHTLDLQKDLPYDAIHDISDMPEAEWHELLKQHDVLFTALDFEMAAIAKSVGLKTIIYDPLTWYWKTIPDAVRQSGAYIAQDFFGVRERLIAEAASFPATVAVVPPIVSQRRPRFSPAYILINLGGLQNPFWSVDDAYLYAETCIEAVMRCVPPGVELKVAVSEAIARRLPEGVARSYNRSEMHEIFEHTKYAFMTPGLGNIYDAAKFDIPTIWLPPANDSQGQQLELLAKHGMIDGHADWSAFGARIDYAAEQTGVLTKIKEALHGVDPAVLSEHLKRMHREVSGREHGKATGLLDTFGTGGAAKACAAVVEFCQT